MKSETLEPCLSELRASFPDSFTYDGETYGSVSIVLRDGRKQDCTFWCSPEGDAWTAMSAISHSREVALDELLEVSDINSPVTLVDGKPFLFNRIVMNLDQSAAIVDFVGQTARYADYLQQKLVGAANDEK